MSNVYQFESNEHFDEFIQSQVEEGRFQNANEMLRAGLGLLETEVANYRERLDELKALAEVGFRELDEGKGILLQNEEELRAFIRGIGRDVRARLGVDEP